MERSFIYGEGDTMRTRLIVAGLVLILAGCRSSQPSRPGATERVLAHVAAASSGEGHKAYTRPGGRSGALLVHGVPGTPHNMKPISDAFSAKGWTVKTVLLPGCGPDAENMYKRSTTDWQKEVSNAQAELSAECDRILVVALSMGCAVSCSSLDTANLDGLALIVPYQWIESPFDRMVWWLFGPLMPETWMPFKDADFNDPELQAKLEKVFPPETIADESLPEVLAAICTFADAVEAGATGD
jgi:alpha-beta hydrolase superfamily lysophospholipase